METDDSSGLAAEFDEETETWMFNWDPETHPEYNVLAECTSDELIKLILASLQYAESTGALSAEVL